MKFRKIQLVNEADKGTEGTQPATSPANDGNSQQPEAKFTQADVDRIVTERLQREKRQAEEKEAKAKADAEAKALEEQKKFEELAAQRQQHIAKLEEESKAQADKSTRYEAALNKLLTTQRKGIPDHVIALLDKLDPVDQLDWIATNGEKLKAAGVPPTPKPNGSGVTAEQEEAARTALARQQRSIF